MSNVVSLCSGVLSLQQNMIPIIIPMKQIGAVNINTRASQPLYPASCKRRTSTASEGSIRANGYANESIVKKACRMSVIV